MPVTGIRCFRDNFKYCINQELLNKIKEFESTNPDSPLNLAVFETAGIRCESIVCELPTNDVRLCKYIKSETVDLSNFNPTGVRFSRIKPDGSTEESSKGKNKGKGKKSSTLTEPPSQGVFW